MIFLFQIRLQTRISIKNITHSVKKPNNLPNYQNEHTFRSLLAKYMFRIFQRTNWTVPAGGSDNGRG